MKSIIYKKSDIEFSDIVKNSNSINEILRKCDLTLKGGNCGTVKRRINLLDIDTSHIKKGYNSNMGRKFEKKVYSDEQLKNEIFCENSKRSRNFIKRKIIDLNLIQCKCASCNMGPHWNSKPISLQLEHKNGISNDNRLDNLEFLCPNCHSQTSTFAGRSLRKTWEEYNTEEFKNACINLTNSDICDKYKLSHSQVLKIKNKFKLTVWDIITTHRRKAEWPSKEILEKEIKENSFVSLGKKYNVSDNAIRKWCKRYKIEF